MIASYKGRKVDVLAFYRTQHRQGPVLLEQTLAREDEGGYIVTGIYKLMQQVLLELFTEEGDMLYLPERGTGFMTEVRQGYLRTPMDVSTAFARAALQIQRNLQAEEEEDDPDDERFVSLTLVNTTVTPGRIVIYAELENRAGKDRSVIFPIDVTIR